MAETLTYTGEFLEKANFSLGLDAYKPSPGLKEAVNLAILLDRPLLLMGEPGCGKTRLAESVAAELHREKMDAHYFRWDVKSTSKSKEGIYQYDALRRLYDANANSPEARDVNNYIQLGKFAQALLMPQNGDKPNVLLIDEIDKADIDFPNDLLLEIEKQEFHIPELNKSFKKKSCVLIFITSNRERELPPAFLRRCLYYFIDFPDYESLVEIVRTKFGKNKGDILMTKAVQLFIDVRKRLEWLFAENEKKPSTSELLDWFKAIDIYRSKGETNGLNEKEKAVIESIIRYEEGKLEDMQIPLPQILLKTPESNRVFEKNPDVSK